VTIVNSNYNRSVRKLSLPATRLENHLKTDGLKTVIRQPGEVIPKEADRRNEGDIFFFNAGLGSAGLTKIMVNEYWHGHSVHYPRDSDQVVCLGEVKYWYQDSRSARFDETKK
jgi:hypothetical protein